MALFRKTPAAHPCYDEASVDLCVEFDMPLIKIASSDINDWVLIEKVASTRRPVIASSGGVSEKDIDDLGRFFAKRIIPWRSTIALPYNHTKTANWHSTRSTTWATPS